MIFWAGIVVAVMLAIFCGKRGLYETWAFAFNSIMAIYIAVFAEPYASAALPSASETPFGDWLVVAGLAAAVFIVLNGISFVFVTGQFSVPFPKALDISGAGLLGFLTGAVIWNFGAFVVCNTPVFPKELAEKVNYDSRVQQFNIAVFSIPCNAVNMIVAAEGGYTTQKAVAALLDKTEMQQQGKTGPKIAPRHRPAEPNAPQQQKEKRELIGPPPEMDSPGA